MTSLMDTIYGSACEALVTALLNEDGEYLCRVRYLENERTRLTAALDKDTAMSVNDLLDEQGAVGELRECACFRAGFRMALELAR